MIDLYLDPQFFKYFFKHRPEITDNEAKKWVSFFSFIKEKDNKKYFLINGNEKKHEDIVRVIFDPSNTNNNISITNIMNYDKISNPHSIVFYHKDKNAINKLKVKHGYEFIGYEDWKKAWKELSLDSSIRIDKSFEWKIIEEISHPFNAFLLMDSYLLSQTKNQLENNIVNLIKTIIYNNKIKNISITIICAENFGNQKTSAEELYSLLSKKLNNIYNIALRLFCFKNSVYPFHKPFLDRYIYTNYYQIDCKHSLEIYNDKNQVIANSQIDINPISSEKKYSAIVSRLKNYQQTLEENKNNPNLKTFGNKDLINPLLNL